MSRTLKDFPRMIAGLQRQTLWVDFGERLPSGTTLSGTPTLTVAVSPNSKASDSSPATRLTQGPSIGTVLTSLGGTGIPNVAIFFQLSNLQAGVTYLLTYQCARSDGLDTIADFNEIYGLAPS